MAMDLHYLFTLSSSTGEKIAKPYSNMSDLRKGVSDAKKTGEEIVGMGLYNTTDGTIIKKYSELHYYPKLWLSNKWKAILAGLSRMGKPRTS